VNVPVSVTGGSYSVGCDFEVPNPPSVASGARICVRHTSGSLGSVVTNTVLTVGGVSDTFSSTTMAGDASPTPFSFADQTGIDLFELITSAPITIQGTSIASPITISGGEYSIDCTGTFTSVAGSVAPGKTVCVRHRSAFTSSTDENTTVIIGDVSDVFTSTTKIGDQTPDDFSFDSQTDVALSTNTTSNTITITGIDSPVRVITSGSGLFGFSVGCTGTFDGADGDIVEAGETLCVGVRSSDTDSTAEEITVTIGGDDAGSQRSATFTVTTGDTQPAEFVFTDQVGVLLNDTVYALPVTITGITAPSRVMVRNGQWQLNCTGSFTSADGLVMADETICVRHIASGSLSTPTSTLLVLGGEWEFDSFGRPVIDPDTRQPVIVGGVSDSFTSTTVVDKPLPGGSAMDPWSLLLLLLAPSLASRRRRGTS